VYANPPPALDGLLDDLVWSHAPRLDNFYCPDLKRLPSESTLVWLAYDSTHLYLAARCCDHRPDQIRMEETKRGGSIWTDDYIELHLDVAHQHREDGAYKFAVTPRGTQHEVIPEGSASKIEWRGDWEAAARVDSLGWTAEVAIPFVIFNRPAGNHTIGVAVTRWLPRTQEGMLWPNMGAKWDYTKNGDWGGVTFPHVSRRPTLMPYMVGQASDSTRDGYLGLDTKYTTTKGIVLVGTLYPDFRNVESEILGLDFSYGERERADNRPFFTEGGESLPSKGIFYSQRVEEMYGGGKLYGQVGNHRLGLLDAYDRDRVNHMAGKWYWQPVPRLEIEHRFAWRHGPEDAPRRDGIPMATDNLAFESKVEKTRMVGDGGEGYEVHGAFTRTASDTSNGYNVKAEYKRWSGGGGGPGLELELGQTSSGFMPIDGLFDLEDANQRSIELTISYYKRRDRTWLQWWEVGSYGHYAARFNGNLYARTLVMWGGGGSSSTGLHAELFDENRPPYHDRTINVSFWWNDDKLYTKGGLWSNIGRVQGTDYLLLGINQGIRIWGPLSTKLSAQYRRRDYPVGHEDKPEGSIEHQYQLISTVQYDITTERAVSGRLIYSHEGMNGYCSYRQTLRKGLDLFLIVGDPSAETWTKRIALKAMFVL